MTFTFGTLIRILKCQLRFVLWENAIAINFVKGD
jgi:hypothetical protein